MSQMFLTNAEIGLILDRRQNAPDFHLNVTYRLKAIKTALAVEEWSIKTGLSLTFASFVNDFGYKDDDAEKMYESIDRIYDAAWPRE
ncbi:hypothetical protein ACTOWA_00450 [Herbaspirillum seropedicae]|uniref:hypothetical protein n=1 Tax=Herbaspirillum seropedicae TaxID=964 RepID=UPI002856AD84|nr:hypothetical protein [Herbaspirillum seropedicae]MDR6397937.1 hypothetical protein [Herbaspirillum seropedicae]